MPGFFVSNFTTGCYGQDETVAIRYNSPPITVETARNNRYKISSILAGGKGLQPTNKLTDFSLYAYKCTRPSTKYDVITIHNGFDQITRPGKVSYNEVIFSFYEILDSSEQTSTNNNGSSPGSRSDDIGNKSAPPPNLSVSSQIRDWHAQAMYNRRYSMLEKPEDFLAVIQLDILDGLGRPTYTYKMYGCWPSEITPSDLSYADGDIADISVTLQVSKYQEFHVSEQPQA